MHMATVITPKFFYLITHDPSDVTSVTNLPCCNLYNNILHDL